MNLKQELLQKQLELNQKILQLNQVEKQLNDYEFTYSGTFSNYFDIHDFDSKDSRRSAEKFIKPKLKDALLNFNQITGEDHTINSGFRTKSHNAKVGGSRGSAHTSGYAVDVRCLSESQRYRYLFAAIQAGFTRIGIHHRFLHLDVDPDKQQEIIWLYGYKKKSKHK